MTDDPTPAQNEASATAGSDTGKAQTLPPLPAPTFSTFVLSMASSALVQLGEVPDPSSGKVESDLIVAKHTIDTLSMLQEKLRQGLEADETRLLEGLLYELRMKYIVKK